MKRLLIFCLTLLSAGPALAAEATAPQPRRGGTVTLAIQRDLVVMNPMIRTASTERLIRELMFDPLLGKDHQGNIQPNLAEAWEISKDGKLYAFRLRRGVKFHNGQEMTAEDVRFSMEYTMNPKNGAYGFSQLSLVERVEVADKYSVRVTLKRPTGTFLYALTSIQSFPIVPKESLQEGFTKPTQFPPGTGPFKFAEWQPQQRIVFDRFDDYWGHKALVDRLILRPINDATTRFVALQAGDVDMIERTPYEWVRQILEGKVKRLGFAKAAMAGYRRLIFNVAEPPFSNQKLRHAVAYAINKKEILDGVYLGFGEPTDQKYPKGHAWYAEGIASYAQDLNKAKALLKEAGYKGETIEILSDQEVVRQSESTVLQAQLKRIGITAKLLVLDWGAYREKQSKGNLHLMFYGGSLDPDPSLTYGPDFQCELDRKNRSSNVSGYCDKEVDALFKRAEVESDLKRRKALFEQILRRVNDDLPELPIGYVPRFFTFRDYVKGFTTDEEGSFRWWGGGMNTVWLDK